MVNSLLWRKACRKACESERGVGASIMRARTPNREAHYLCKEVSASEKCTDDSFELYVYTAKPLSIVTCLALCLEQTENLRPFAADELSIGSYFDAARLVAVVLYTPHKYIPTRICTHEKTHTAFIGPGSPRKARIKKCSVRFAGDSCTSSLPFKLNLAS